MGLASDYVETLEEEASSRYVYVQLLLWISLMITLIKRLEEASNTPGIHADVYSGDLDGR